jgi:hypothetical protein
MSDTESTHNSELAYGFDVRYPNDLWNWRLSFSEVQENFDPKLGFVRRDNIRRYSGNLSYEPRPDHPAIRQYEFSLETDLFTNTKNIVETWAIEAQPLGIEFESGDVFRLEVEHTHDVLFEDFEIRPNNTIPIGKYDFTNARIEAETSQRRDLSVGLTFGFGEFFNGTRERYSAFLAWRSDPLFTGEFEYSQNEIGLPTGDFQTQFATLRANFSFTPEIAWNNFAQWDNESDQFAMNSRLLWIPQPGREVFLVFNETLEKQGTGFSPLFQELSFKIGYTIRL